MTNKLQRVGIHSLLGFWNSFLIRHSSFVICFAVAARAVLAGPDEVVVHPKAYGGPLRNPLMGFIGPVNGKQQYATLSKQYVRWNQIENSSADGVDKLREYGEAHWKGIEQ